MSPTKAKKRTSILKRRYSSVDSPEATVTNTKKKGILFSEKKTVKEFFQCDDKATIWGSSYEASIAKSEGSSDSSQTSRKISFDFSSSNIHTSNFTASLMTTDIIESEKENLAVSQVADDGKVVEGRRTNSLNLSSSNNSGLSLENITVAFSEEEKKRLKQYGTDLNVTNMELDNSLAPDESRVLSPRKTIYFHENSNFSVCLQDKVLQKPTEIERGSVLMNITGNISAMVEDDEAMRFKGNRKTIVNNDDMNLTLQHDHKPPKVSAVSIPVKPSVFKMPKSPTEVAIPKALKILAEQSDIELSSPPIKPPKLQDPRQTSEDFMEFMVTDTPTKNLCHQMCMTKKHKVTPLQNQPATKFACTPSKSDRNKQIMSQLATPQKANDSMDMLRTMGLELEAPSTQKNNNFGVSLDVSMQLDTETKKRKSIFSSESVQETLIEPKSDNLSTVRQTLFESSISIEEPAEIQPVVSQRSRNTVYDDERMNESLTASAAPQPQQSFFDLDDGTIIDTKAMTLVNINNLVQPEQPRQSIASGDASGRYEDPDTPKGGYSVLMNISNATDISETTTELQAKANRLLLNPMATTASTSNLFTKSFQHDMDETGVSQKVTPLHNTLPGENHQRKTIYDTNMSLTISSAVHLNHAKENKSLSNKMESSNIKLESSKKSSLALGSMISMEDVNISGIEPTQEVVINPRKTIYEESMEEESFKPHEIIKKRSSKQRETILGNHPMDSSTTEVKVATTKASMRMTTYKRESIDETLVAEPSLVQKVLSPSYGKDRVTVYEDVSVMEESVVEQNQVHEEPKVPQVPGNVKTRYTIYESAMEEEIYFDQLRNCSSGATVFSDNVKEIGRQKSLLVFKNRPTTFSEDIETKDIEIPIVKPSFKLRRTIFDAAMDQEENVSVPSVYQSKSQQTLYNEHIDVGQIDVVEQQKPKQSSKARKTIFQADMEKEKPEVKTTTQRSKSRQTIYDVAMEESIVDVMEISMTRHATVNQALPDRSLLRETTTENASHIDMSCYSLAENIILQQSLSPNSLVPPPPGFQTPTITGPLPLNFNAVKINDSQTSANVFKHPSLASGGSSVVPSKSATNKAVDSTFVVKQCEDSRRLMNITDADFNSLLDDESDPCLNESSQPLSASSNTSMYHEALQEFVNITLKNTSILSQTVTGSGPGFTRAQNLDFSTSIDYCQNFDDLVHTLKTKPIKEQPRMEIDVFLENLNIRPPAIPRLPQLQPGYLERKLTESSEKHKRKLADEKAKWNAQLPAIPSGAFLMKNYIECLDDEIKGKKESDMLGMTQVFPESRDFEFLLKNKFETDSSLSDFWTLHLQFSHMNQFKFSHKQFGAYRINFTVQNPTGNLSDSTIPVYFENILLYTSPSHRGELSLRIKLLTTTFKREIGTDNFTSICPSTNELFSFLEVYHEHVVKSVQLVDNFFKIVLKHLAIIKRHENGLITVVKRHFRLQPRDIVDISISVRENIADVSINDIQVQGLTRFSYKLEPRQAVSSLRGLMLIEVILFDVEKFIQENTHQLQAVKNF